jgi:hypothetical protein
MDLLARTKLATRARGLVFVHVGLGHCREILHHSITQLNERCEDAHSTAKQRAVWQFRRQVKRQLTHMIRSNDFGGGSITTRVKKRMLLAGHDMYRPDSQLCLAYQLNTTGQQIECIGVVTYSTARLCHLGPPRRFDDDLLHDAIEDGRVLEVELLMVKQGGLRGTGSLLLMYILAKELARKSRGAAKYTGVLLELARNMHPAPPVMPLVGIATRMGFVPVTIPEDRVGPSDYYALIRSADLPDIRTRLEQALPSSEVLSHVCPVRPNSGIPYCS